ncbi:MAG TPA: permease prefix domain 1-containing protein, partial [Bryobacteraceae bacterium]|nr:permease prefix domain 1-containing protein [Bryobacteraceae bacterium]
MSRQDDFNEEIREHIEMETRENMDRGMPQEEARRAARVSFGSATAVEQQLREGARFAWIGTLFQDIRYALRLLRRSWVLASAVIVTLTLGIGMNAGVFTVLNGMLLRPRVEKDPASFAHIAAQYSGDNIQAVLDSGMSTADFRALAAGSKTLENVGAWAIGRATVGRDDPT